LPSPPAVSFAKSAEKAENQLRCRFIRRTSVEDEEVLGRVGRLQADEGDLIGGAVTGDGREAGHVNECSPWSPQVYGETDVAVVGERKTEAMVDFIDFYDTWDEASRHCDAQWDSSVILDRVRSAALQVKESRAAFERDGVTFKLPEYRWPMLACTLWAAAQKRCTETFHVVDFGGSLGTAYTQHLTFLDAIPNLLWSVVEQPHFVRCGRLEFESERLRFFESIADACQRVAIDLAIFSGCLQYLASPYEQMQEVIDLGIPLILCDRTPYTTAPSDRISAEEVPEDIYPARFPSWLFSRQRFLAYWIDRRYLDVAHFPSLDGAGPIAQYEGFLFKRAD
jgi:putative methyltransferase (TIGR04325 family)